MNLQQKLNLHKKDQKVSLDIQTNQIRSILSDFRKMKYKCIELSKQLDQQMIKEQYFRNIQVGTIRKIDLLDVSGLVRLKNQLVKALTQLFQIERDLRYKKQKNISRKQIMGESNNSIKSTNLIKSTNSIKTNNQIHQSSNKNINEIEATINSQQQKINHKQNQTKSSRSKLQIPLYSIKPDTSQNKLDKISKYIATLKKSMKKNTQTFNYKWKIKQLLKEDKLYQQMMQEICKYQMRQQQLDRIMSQLIQYKVLTLINQGQVITSNPNHKLIKIPKKKQSTKHPLQLDINTPNSIQSLPLTSPITFQDYSQKQSYQQVRQSCKQILQKLNKRVKKSQQVMESKRNRKVKEQEIWNQLKML